MGMSTQVSQEGKAVNLQAEHALAITPGVTVRSPGTLYIGTGGSVIVTTAWGESGVVFVNLPSGSILPVLVVAVTAATASNLILLR